MAYDQGSGHEALRHGRSSAPGAEYFLTICTDKRTLGLSNACISDQLIAAALRLEQTSVWAVRTMTVMPDHVHLLINLGSECDLSQAIRLYKGRLAVTLRASRLSWERGYFDHRLHVHEDRLPVFTYIFLNPYRAQLLSSDQRWHGYYCRPEDWTWFERLTANACPLPEWLK